MEREEQEANLSPSQLLQLAETHLRCRNYSLCRQYALESHHPNDPDHHLNHHYAAQLIALSEILSAASNSSGPTNWYSVLQVDTFSDDLALIRTQFKKLLRLLESANGKFPLAGEALNLVSKAYEILSNPSQKTQLDSQLSLLLNGDCSGDGRGGGGESSFWTFCPYCFYVYQYAKVYEGCCLRCQNESCRRAFHGVSLHGIPKMELEKGQYFGCFGYFPMGFSPEDQDRGKGKGKFDSWSPIVGFFPVKRAGKTRAGRIDLDGDDGGGGNENNVHRVDMLDDSEASEAPPYENEYENMEVRNAGVQGGKIRMTKRKSVAWNARKGMGQDRSNVGTNEARGRSEYGHADENIGFEGMHDVGMGSGCDLDADDVTFFEEDGEIFVGFGPDDAL